VTGRGNTAPREGDASGQTNIVAVCGPMARTVEDLAVVMQVWWPNDSETSTFYTDPYIPPMPFAEPVYRLPRQHCRRIGFIMTDGWFEPSAVCKRAVSKARQVCTFPCVACL
jgi:Asp-tRNA(Asn)/Glu-tRNA(Gln) amidotransferase A subunit family amidase